MRLTLLYAGLFLLLGTGLLAVTFVATKQSSAIDVRVSRASPLGPFEVSPAPVAPPSAPSTPSLPAVPSVPSAPSVPSGSTSPAQTFVVAQHNADLGRLLTVSWVVLALTTIGAAVLGWFAAGRVLRPLRKISTTARTISVGNLHERLAMDGPDDEFKRLGDTLDDLFGRLESSFEAQRRFVANASHELRTPLTLERTLLQVALADPNASAQTLRSTCEELLVSQSEHAQLLEGLLTLASSERGLEQREPVELATLTEHVLAHLPPGCERLELTLEASLNHAPTTGDPALIRRLIANLVDNAVDHNVGGGRVEIRTEARAAHAVLEVSNTGPHIPSDQIERLFEPFQRLTASRTDTNGHHGLGLSIVRAIATAHNATITVEAQPGGGLAVTVRFPDGLDSDWTVSAGSAGERV